MPTVFEVLYELALDIRTQDVYKKFTAHHNPNRVEVEGDLRTAITTLTIPGERFIPTKWHFVRTFVRNYVNRAHAVASSNEILDCLSAVEDLYTKDIDRIKYLPREIANRLNGSRIDAFIGTLEKLTDPNPIKDLNNQSYLDWIDQQWIYWVNKKTNELYPNEMISSLKVMYKNKKTKLFGIGLPLAANFFADCGLPAFAKPDLHVCPIISMLTFAEGEENIFKGLVEITKIESTKINRRNFEWLEDLGGLRPRHLDRIIYLIASDSFVLNDRKNKSFAPKRRILIKQRLIDAGLIRSEYSSLS